VESEALPLAEDPDAAEAVVEPTAEVDPAAEAALADEVDAMLSVEELPGVAIDDVADAEASCWIRDCSPDSIAEAPPP
jgi:hypothetical protein